MEYGTCLEGGPMATDLKETVDKMMLNRYEDSLRSLQTMERHVVGLKAELIRRGLENEVEKLDEQAARRR
jgi:hypothetical protein